MNQIEENYRDILEILLIDRTTNENIIWATSDIKDNIKLDECEKIKCRVEKTEEEKKQRSKRKAEVFTPSYVCNKQNNLVDNEWFETKNTFNFETEKGWETNLEKIKFPDNKSWYEYVSLRILEITCGEAPYLVSRYDTVNGEKIDLFSRIGLFDRKMRVICENANDEEWLEQSLIALKSVYGYEFQGDNLFIARKNIFLSYIDYYLYHFSKMPDNDLLINVAEIISWNLWQMDGLKMVIPFSSVYCNIKDWKNNKEIIFKSLIKEEKNASLRKNN